MLEDLFIKNLFHIIMLKQFYEIGENFSNRTVLYQLENLKY